MIFVSLRVSFLLEHFELEIQFLEIENLRFNILLCEKEYCLMLRLFLQV